MEAGSQCGDPTALSPGKGLGTDFTGAWEGHSPFARIHPRTTQAVASRYADWAILTHFHSL